MKKIDLGQTISILANLGVIAGIVFLGVEIRQVGEQFELDRGNATAERLNAIISRANNWAQLVATNPQAWNAGASGRPLEPEDHRVFEAMAAAWENQRWTMWTLPTVINSSLDAEVDLQRRQVALTAIELRENPGLLSYWRAHTERLREIDENGGEFSELIENELARLAEEN